MRRNSWNYFLAVAALAVLLMPAFAMPLSKTVDLTTQQKIAGKELRQGSHTFKVDETKLTILLKNKIVAEQRAGGNLAIPGWSTTLSFRDPTAKFRKSVSRARNACL